MHTRYPASSRWIALNGLLAVLTTFGCCRQAQSVSPSRASSSTAPASSEEDIRRSLLEGDHGVRELDIRIAGFKCRDMVVVVNALRYLGKDKALNFLTEFNAMPVADGELFPGVAHQMKAICICRLLFLPPTEGWTQPWSDFRTKYTNLIYDETALQHRPTIAFPLYPLVLSEGLPFLVDAPEQMALGGVGVPIPDEARKVVDRCRTLEMIPADLPTTGFAEAASKLLASDTYKALFDPTQKVDKKVIELLPEIIMHQAR